MAVASNSENGRRAPNAPASPPCLRLFATLRHCRDGVGGMAPSLRRAPSLRTAMPPEPDDLEAGEGDPLYEQEPPAIPAYAPPLLRCRRRARAADR